MTKTTSWIVALATVVGAIGIILVMVAGIVVADAYGQATNDRACVAALDGLRAERAAGGAGPELRALEAITDRYCSEVESN